MVGLVPGDGHLRSRNPRSEDVKHARSCDCAHFVLNSTSLNLNPYHDDSKIQVPRVAPTFPVRL